MAQEIPFVDLLRQHEPLQSELEEAFGRVSRTSAYVLGDEVAEFEQAFATYCGVEHCVGVASGTAALALAFLAAGIGKGDEVIVPAHTFIASALGVIHAGATPVLCDVDPGTGLMDPDAAAEKVGERTAALLLVHLYGQAGDGEALGSLADRHGLALFEDAAQAHGAEDRGCRVGSIGVAGAFSFYPSKPLGALGDGGAICTNDAELAHRARALRHLGQRRKGHHDLLGFNERLDGLQAAFLRLKLAHVDRWNAQRQAHAQAYREALQDDYVLLELRPEASCVYHLFPIRTSEREALAERLAAEGIATGIHYSPALHGHPALRGRLGESGEFPAAEAWAREELSLPMFDGLQPEEIARVVAACTG